MSAINRMFIKKNIFNHLSCQKRPSWMRACYEYLIHKRPGKEESSRQKAKPCQGTKA